MTTPSHHKRILIVEDEAITALYLKELLLKKGYDVVSIESSAEDSIVRTEELKPDLVLMDIFLPGKMNGIEASRLIYTRFRIPIIFLTSYSQDSLVELATQTEPFGYLIKPFNEVELYATIEIALLKHRSANYLLELNATRDKFFSVIAHDLRNPLAALFQTTDILKERFHNFSQQEVGFFLEEINRTAHTLYKLTDNLLEWAKLQSNQVEFRPKRVKLYAIVDYVFSIVQSNASQKHITLRNVVSNHHLAWADVDMLVSILNNLLSNAIKFSQPESEIRVIAHKKGAFMEVSVQDKGVGIEEEYLGQLFYAMHKGLGTQNEKGTGLGLLLTREFVEKNGGKISVTSTVGEGSCFTFTLPVNDPGPS